MKRKNIYLLGLIALLTGVVGYAQQVGTSISDDGTPPNNNAMLDVQSPLIGDGKGILIPRLTLVQRTTASSGLAGGLLNNSGELRGGAANGLLVYQTDGVKGLYYNNSSSVTPAWRHCGDLTSDGSVAMSGDLNMGGNEIINVDAIAFSANSIEIGKDARSYSSSYGSVAVGRNATARYRVSGVAIGADADGDYNGIGIGYSADGQYTNIAIGFASSAYGGYDRIAIGRCVTNRRDNTISVRGDLYLDGGDEVYYRPVVGSGSWTVKALTIDHPQDPENKVLRHFCVEGPSVLNIYQGRAQLVDGEVSIPLPGYYSALNRVGAEVYSLTPIGAPASLYVRQEASGNHFIVGGNHDVAFSWTIHVPRNDTACLEDLERRPVEQNKSELHSGQTRDENRRINTDVSTLSDPKSRH